MKNIYPAFLPELCYSKRKLKEVTGVVIHYFSARYVAPELMYDFHTNWNLFIELNMPDKRGVLMDENDTQRYYASAHVLMNRAGDAYQLTPYDRQAYHVGKSEWQGKTNCNAFTYGIEVMGTDIEPFEEVQYEELAKVIIKLWEQCGKTFTLDRDGITGHEDIATPKGRKKDPGKYFDWDKLFTYINSSVN